MDPHFAFLKRHTRSHKYRANLTPQEIRVILNRHVPALKKLDVFNLNSKLWPEVQDQYFESQDLIVQKARSDLQNEFKKKIRVPKFSDTAFGLEQYLKNI